MSHHKQYINNYGNDSLYTGNYPTRVICRIDEDYAHASHSLSASCPFSKMSCLFGKMYFRRKVRSQTVRSVRCSLDKVPFGRSAKCFSGKVSFGKMSVPQSASAPSCKSIQIYLMLLPAILWIRLCYME